jgi:hypothetical protein
MNDINLLRKSQEFAQTDGFSEYDTPVININLGKFVKANVDMPEVTELSVKDFVGHSAKHPVINFVYHDFRNKVAVATNGVAMLINPDEYDDEIKKSTLENTDWVPQNMIGYPDYTKSIPKELIEADMPEAIELQRRYFEAMEKGFVNNHNPYIQLGDEDNTCIDAKYVPYILAAGIVGWKRAMVKNFYAYIKEFDGGGKLIIATKTKESADAKELNPLLLNMDVNNAGVLLDAKAAIEVNNTECFCTRVETFMDANN